MIIWRFKRTLHRFLFYKPLYTFLDSFESSYLAPPRTATSALAEIFGFNKHDSASRLHLYNQIVCPIKDFQTNFTILRCLRIWENLEFHAVNIISFLSTRINIIFIDLSRMKAIVIACCY